MADKVNDNPLWNTAARFQAVEDFNSLDKLPSAIKEIFEDLQGMANSQAEIVARIHELSLAINTVIDEMNEFKSSAVNVARYKVSRENK